MAGRAWGASLRVCLLGLTIVVAGCRPEAPEGRVQILSGAIDFARDSLGANRIHLAESDFLAMDGTGEEAAGRTGASFGPAREAFQCEDDAEDLCRWTGKGSEGGVILDFVTMGPGADGSRVVTLWAVLVPDSLGEVEFQDWSLRFVRGSDGAWVLGDSRMTGGS